ncbi:hypothetical protein [Anaerocellum danielii]|uniref:hypothetical protein n=1 Tax=Anaerocellum danielii TaxID=1387557 RepID=UPI001F2BC406|nr:hypothetical protein [Caldicellulosiruptor danielii]
MLWVLWIISLICAIAYHLVRWNKVFRSSERFLIFSSCKLKPEVLLCGEILHLILDLFLFSIWFNLLGAIVITPKRYISILTFVLNRVNLDGFYLIVISIFFFGAIYFWCLTENQSESTSPLGDCDEWLSFSSLEPS